MSSSSASTTSVGQNNRSDNFSISQSFRDQKHLGTFLQNTKLLNIIEQAAEKHIAKFNENKCPEDYFAPIVICLPFIYKDFLKHIDLLHLLMEEPLLFENTVKYKVYSIIRDIVKQSNADNCVRAIDIEQIHIQLTVLGLPSQQELIFNPSKNYYRPGLCSVQGILTAFTELEKITVQTVWFCSSGCNKNRISSKSTETPVCHNCNKSMTEYVKLRVTHNTRSIRLLPEAAVQMPRTVNKLFRAITVTVKIASGKYLSCHRILRLQLECASFSSMEPNAIVDNVSSITNDNELSIKNNISLPIHLSNKSELTADHLGSVGDDELRSNWASNWHTQQTKLLNNSYQSQQSLLNSDMPASFMGDGCENSVLLQTNETDQTEIRSSLASNKCCAKYMEFLPNGIHKEYLNLSSLKDTQQSQCARMTCERNERNIFIDDEFAFNASEMNIEELFAIDRKVKSQINNSDEKNSTIETDAIGPVLCNRDNLNCSQNEGKSHTCVPANNTSNQDYSLITRSIYLDCNSTVDYTMIPTAVKQLYDVIKTKYSDFAFIYALSAQLCQDRVPMECFVKLKIGLLLSLASFDVNAERPPIPIVVIGSDKRITNYLMTEVGQLALRFVNNMDFAPITSNRMSQNQIWYSADPILLAKGGIYFVGDWSHLKPARAERILKIIECSRVPSNEQSMQSYPLNAAVWTHWNSFNHTKDEHTFNKFIKIFGLPILMDDSNHEVVTDFIFERVSKNDFESTRDNLAISADNMRSYLTVISQRSVDLTAEASLLLQKYFVASRVDRPDCLTKQGFVVLKQFAESFAKLAFRHEVMLIDALSAIYMCEHFLQDIFGASANPPPLFQAHNFIGLVDSHLSQFQQWLESYIVKYGGTD